MVELVGYVASALIVLSLAMTSVVRLRIISLLGSITFSVYGFLIASPPVIITNTSIAILNIYFLYKEFTKKNLAMVPIDAKAPFLTDFLAAHQSEIAKLQPGFALRDDSLAWLLNRDALPAGVLIGHRIDDRLYIDLDFVTAAYRDSRMGSFIYGDGSKTFKDLGVRQLVATAGSAEVQRYLESMKFTPLDGEYILEL